MNVIILVGVNKETDLSWDIGRVRRNHWRFRPREDEIAWADVSMTQDQAYP